MKIAFIGQKGIPTKFGGVEKHVEELTRELATRGHEVFVYVRNNYTDKYLTEYQGVKLVHLPSIPTKHLDAISHTLLASIHALFQNYDIIHYQAIGPSFLSFLPKLFLSKSKIVATFHCQDYYHKKWNWLARTCLRLGEYITCTVPDKTIVVSNTLRSYVKNEYRKEAEMIPNGFSVFPTEKTDQLERWGMEKDNYIFFVSRLIRHKGIHYLVEAFKNLEDAGKTRNQKLVIVGDGFYTDEYVKELKASAQGRENIIFTGALSGEPLHQIFSHGFLFVQPSETEGLSISLLEAMGYGKGVLVSNIPENTEAMGKHGFVFQSSNVKDLEEKLEYLINNPALVKEAGKAAQKEAEEKYNWKHIAEQTEKIYTEVLNSVTGAEKCKKHHSKNDG